MDFQSAMETFAEAWAAANTVKSEVASDLSQVSWLLLVWLIKKYRIQYVNHMFEFMLTCFYLQH